MKRWMVLIGVLIVMAHPAFATDINLVLGNQDIVKTSSPLVGDDKFLVPAQFVADRLETHANWNDEFQTIEIVKGSQSIKFWMNSPVFLTNGRYKISDVAPKIVDGKAFIPVKQIGNAFNVDLTCDEAQQVLIDSSDLVTNGTLDFKMISHENMDIISGKTTIDVDMDQEILNRADTLKLLLLDKDSMTGFVVASQDTFGKIEYLPKVEDKGSKLLVAAVYDSDRNFLAGDVLEIIVDVKPKVSLTGLDSDVFKGSATLGQTFNFLPQYVSYKLKKVDTGEEKWIKKRDPLGTYSFMPSYEKRGVYDIQAVAYDGFGEPYYSPVSRVKFDVERNLRLGGLREKTTIKKPVSLIAVRNFDVKETFFNIEDKKTGVVKTLANIPWGSYKWFPDERYSGEKILTVSVVDTNDVTHTSSPVHVTVEGTPKLLLQGIGPNQVLTSETTLTSMSNVSLSNVSYHLKGGEIIGSAPYGKSVTFAPKKSGPVSIYASAIYKGQSIKSETVTLNVYLKDLYRPKAVVAKSEFQKVASQLAIQSFKETGMSASLQVAQAILETGWGQKLPVDKYNGKFSYNLFGIKGSATNGSVTSNTWEVYNGKKFRVDANFRAYNNIKESWKDHKRILLELSRYKPYRAVMFDSTLGAYAIRRSGYATDPRYPMKLIEIIQTYGLKELDRVGVYLK